MNVPNRAIYMSLSYGPIVTIVYVPFCTKFMALAPARAVRFPIPREVPTWMHTGMLPIIIFPRGFQNKTIIKTPWTTVA